MKRQTKTVPLSEPLSAARNSTHLLILAHALHDPCLNVRPAFVDGEEASLAPTFDELVRLDNKRSVDQPGIFLLNLGEANVGPPLEYLSLHLPFTQGIHTRRHVCVD